MRAQEKRILKNKYTVILSNRFGKKVCISHEKSVYFLYKPDLSLLLKKDLILWTTKTHVNCE